MARILIVLVFILIWVFLLRVLRRAGLDFWHYLVGTIGMFIILFVYVREPMTMPIARIVALLASIPGKFGHLYEAYYKYGTIFIDSGGSAISMQIDFECSGIIEIIAYISLLAFYKVYTISERVTLGMVGVMCIIISNAIRIAAICLIIYFAGTDMYFIAHTIIGRLIFYTLTVILYFYVFTKSQIVKQKVGAFGYDNNK